MPVAPTAKRITPALFIRQHILGMTVGAFAAELDVSTAVVVRYDLSGSIPEKHRKYVKRLGVKRGITIPDSWFAAVPWKPGVPA